MTNDAPIKRWLGTPPTTCDLCHGTLGKVFYDCATRHGWGIACHGCFLQHGSGLGTGRGQKYDRKTLVKVAG